MSASGGPDGPSAAGSGSPDDPEFPDDSAAEEPGGGEGRSKFATGPWMGLLAFVSVQAFLIGVGDFRWFDAALLAFLLVVMPLLSIAQLPLLRAGVIDRIPAYWSSIVTLSVIGGLSLGATLLRGTPPSIGLVPLPLGSFAFWTVIITVSALGVTLILRWVGLRLGWREASVLRALLPQTAPERRLFVFLSVAAGVGEELAFRGYAIPLLMPMIGPIGAVALTSLVFGLLHVYQGWIGVPRTTLMGVALACGFLASGSLLPSIAAHTLIDWIAGLAFGDRLMLPERTNGVDHSTPQRSSES